MTGASGETRASGASGASGETRASGVRVQLSLLGYALGALGRRAGKTLALSLGLAAAVALLSAVVFLTDALRAEASRARAGSPDLVVQRMAGGRPALIDEQLSQKLASLPGVRRAVPRVWGYVFLPSIQGNVTVVGQPSSGPLPKLPPSAIEQGRALEPGERGSCVLGRDLARALGLRAGDKLRFPAPDDRGLACKIVGLLSSPVSLYTSDVALMSDDDARQVLLLPPGQAADVAVEIANPDESAVLAGDIAGMFPGARVVERRLLERVHALSYGRRSGLVLGASLPALLSLLVLAIDRAGGLGASERKEIAVLKASGWSSADVLAEKLYESLLVALSATTLGLLLGYGWAFWLGAPGLREALMGWSTLYPSSRLTPEVTLSQLIGLGAMVAAPYVALSIGPAWRASSLDPMEALRGALPHGTTCPPSPPRPGPRRLALAARGPAARLRRQGQPGAGPARVGRPVRGRAARLRLALRRGRDGDPAGAGRAQARRRRGRVPVPQPSLPAARRRRRPLRRGASGGGALRALHRDALGGRVPVAGEEGRRGALREGGENGGFDRLDDRSL